MITEALLQLVGGIAAALVSLLPALDWDTSDFGGAAEGWGATLGGFNAFVPVTAMFAISALILTVWVGMAIWNGIVWIYHQFWGSS